MPKLPEEANTSIQGIPSQEEIKAVFSEMGGGKSPGPDGLPASFYQNNWELVGGEITDLIQGFFRTGVMPEELNYLLDTDPKEEDLQHTGGLSTHLTMQHPL